MNLLFHFILNKMPLDLLKKVANLFISIKTLMQKRPTFSINILSELQLSD